MWFVGMVWLDADAAGEGNVPGTDSEEPKKGERPNRRSLPAGEEKSVLL